MGDYLNTETSSQFEIPASDQGLKSLNDEQLDMRLDRPKIFPSARFDHRNTLFAVCFLWTL